MSLSISDPFSRGFERMRTALFKPFDLGKWFTVGFTAFLAGLLDGGGGGGGSSIRGDKYDHHELRDFFDFPSHAWDWLSSHPVWTSLILFGILFLVALIVLFTWLSSRGKFMFLDNVVHNRAKVSQPWRDYAGQGDSLFLWRLIYGFVVLFVFMTFLIMCFISFREMYFSHARLEQYIVPVIVAVLFFLLLIIFFGYINLFLDSFIVPIMYRQGLSATKAWGVFLSLLSKHFFFFILYGLFVFVLLLAVIIGILLLGIMTCCIGFIFLVIPYINAVVLLPVSYTFRAFSIEFLRQFGPEYDVFPAEAAA